MYRVVLCLLLVSHVILGAEDTKKKAEPSESSGKDEEKSQEEEEDLGLDEKWAITDENLEKTQKEVPNFIVLIYVNSCGNCKSFAPTWKAIAEKLNNNPDSKTKVFSANIANNKENHNNLWKSKITSLPGAFYVRRGEWRPYAGQGTEENVLQFAKQFEEDATVEITPAELAEYLSASDVSVVGKFSSDEDAKEFDNLAWKMVLPAAAILLDDTRLDGITVHSNLEGRPYRVTRRDLNDQKETHRFIASARRPLVIPYNKDNHNMVFELDEVTTSVLLFHSKDSDGYEERLETMRKVSRTYGRLLNLVEMEMSDEEVKKFADFFKIKSEDLPIVCIIDTDEEKKTKGQISTTKDLTEKGIAQLIVDYREGESEMVSLSQSTAGQENEDKPKAGQEEQDELPDDWESRPIKYLTSTNFQEYVLNPAYTVFVMIYKDSCPHCQKFKPIWEQLAKKYEEHETLKFAHMKRQHVDDVTDLAVKYLPSLVLYPKGIKNLTDGFLLQNSEEERLFWLDDLEEFLTDVLASDESSDENDEQFDRKEEL